MTLVIAILFTIAAVASLFFRRGAYWWLAPIIFTIGAVINWLRYLDMLN